jgi:hypothetical protein
MGSTRSNAMRGLGWLLRAQHDGLLKDPPPERWLELLNCLDDKERIRLKMKLRVDSGHDPEPLKL